MPAVADNLTEARDRVADAARAAGRDPGDVTLVAVTKYATDEQVAALLAAGARDLGENRPRQLADRAVRYADTPGVRWHQIGQLQRNKVRKVVPAAHLTHSVDSDKLLAAVDRVAGEEGATARILLQVNVSGEASKSGLAPGAARRLWESVEKYNNVRVEGLMTLAPLPDREADRENPAAVAALARPVFAGLRDLRDELAGPARLPVLSMGMSGDFEAAIAEGATHVRLGSVLLK